MRRVYVGIDLHSSNSVIAIQYEGGGLVARARLPNRLAMITDFLEPYRDAIQQIAVESTFNWYWLVDGLQEAGYAVSLANTAAVQQYEGLKYGDDDSDAYWLATMLRLKILPEGHIYPKAERGIRDLMRKRSQLVRCCTRHILSIENLAARNTGQRLNANFVRRMTDEQADALFADTDRALALKSNLVVMRLLMERISILEQELVKRVRLRAAYKQLLSVPGIGKVLALTIMLETGDIARFSKVGNYVSYCRCVKSVRLSDGKRKGRGNAKNGNKYLSWAFAEAAVLAIRHDQNIARFYHRKLAKTHRIVALRAVSHKLARACYHIIKNGDVFDLTKAFAGSRVAEAQGIES